MKSANVSVQSVSGHCVEAVPVNELLMPLHELCVCVSIWECPPTHLHHHHRGLCGFDDNDDDNDDDDDAVGNDNEYVDGRSHPVIHQGLV